MARKKKNQSISRERPSDCNCSRWNVDGEHHEWCNHVLGDGFTFGFSIDIAGKRYRQTGRYPSPSFPDFEAVLNAAVDFFNVHLGTSYAAVRVYTKDEVEEVNVGEYRLKESAQ